MNIQSCRNINDAVPLYLPQNLYLKPIARIHLSVQLPSLKSPGKSISNWELMEKMRSMILPDTFTILKVSKSTMEFIRFEGEIEDKTKLEKVLSRLDGRQIKLGSFPDHLRMRAVEAKIDFPTRHSWDSYFRDAKNMNEMKAGERPDTIHISNLPIKWFVNRAHANEENVKPSENIFRKVFEKFGEVRCVDIPICDPYRPMMKSHMSGMQTFSFDQDLYFEGYIQFTEYMAFVRAMETFRGMKLLHKEDEQNLTVNIKLDFDKTKHLSDACVRRRKIVRDKFMAVDREKEEKKKKEVEAERKKIETEREKVLAAEEIKEARQREREERRKAKHLKKIKEKEAEEITQKIVQEKKKLLQTQRKLESVRLLDELFKRIKIKKERDLSAKNGKNDNSRKHHKGEEKLKLKKSKHDEDINSLRDKLVTKYKLTHEQQLEEQRAKLRETMEGKGLLKVVLQQTEKPSTSRRRLLSETSLSSESSDDNESSKKKSKKKRKKSKKKRKKSEIDSDQDSSSDNSKKSKSVIIAPHDNNNADPFMPPDWFAYGHPSGMYNYPPTPFFPPALRGGFFPPFGGMRGQRGGQYPRRRGAFNPNRARGAFRGRGRGVDNPNYINYYDTEEYYRYFKKLSGGNNPSNHDDRNRRTYSRSRSRSRSRRSSRSNSRSRRSYTRSRSRSRSRTRSRRRSYSSRSHSRSRSRSRSRRTRSRSKRRTRSKSRNRSRSRNRDRSKSRSRSRSYSRRRSHSTENSKSKKDTRPVDFIPRPVRDAQANKEIQQTQEDKTSNDHDMKNRSNRSKKSRSPSYKSIDSSEFISPARLRQPRSRSKSWSLPRSTKTKEKSWSHSPSPKP